MSRRVDDIVIVIGADTSTYEKSMKATDKALASLRKEMAEATKGITTQANALEKLQAANGVLTKQIEEQKKKVDISKQAFEKIQEATDATAAEIKKLEKAYTNALNELTRMEQALEQNNFQQYATKIKDVTNEMGRLELEATRLTDQNQKLGITQERLEAQADNLRQRLDLQRRAIDEVRAELERARGVYGENSDEVAELSKRLYDAEKAHEQLAKQVKTAEVGVRAMGTSFGEMGASLDGTRAKMTAAGVDMDALERKAQMVSAAVLAIGIAAAKAFLDFGKEAVKMRTLLDETYLSYASAQSEVIRLSNETGVAAGDMAMAMYDALSSGVETANILEFMGVAAKTSVAGFSGVTDAVDILTTAINSYGLEAERTEDIANKLLLTQDRGKVTVGELASGFGSLAGTAASARVPIEETLAAIAALTASGLDGSRSISSMTQVLSNIISPSAQAAEEAKRLGIQFNAQALASKGLAGFLEDVDKRTHGNIESTAKLFGSVRALNDVLILTNNGADVFNETLDEMYRSTGKLEENFNKVASDPAVRFFNSLNELKNAAIKIGSALTPLIDALSTLFTVISAIPAPVLIFLGALVTVITVVVTLVNAFSKLQKGIGAIQEGWSAMTGALGGSDGKFAQVLGWILAIAAALTILLTLILLIKEGSERGKRAIEQAMEAARVQTSNAQNSIKTPRYAHGTLYAAGGEAIVGEQGPERVILPRGAQVSTARDTRRTASGGDTYITTLDANKLSTVQSAMRILNNTPMKRRSGKHRRR